MSRIGRESREQYVVHSVNENGDVTLRGNGESAEIYLRRRIDRVVDPTPLLGSTVTVVLQEVVPAGPPEPEDAPNE